MQLKDRAMDSSSRMSQTIVFMAVVKGELTAIGGRQADNAVKTLISLPQKGSGIFQQKWIEQFPPMAFYLNFPAVTTSNTHLIVAGGFGPDRRRAAVEVMDIEKLQWSTVASLLALSCHSHHQHSRACLH